MFNRTILAVLLFSPSLVATAKDHVFHGAQSIREWNHYAEAVHVDFGDEQFPSIIMDMLPLMPRLQTLVVGGPRYLDCHLTRLASFKTLRVLVLDSVDVSNKAVSELRATRPDLIVIRSQRLAIETIQSLHPEIAVTTRLFESHPKIRELLGDRFFREATEVDFGRLPDDETGPFDRILNEQLAPIRMLPTLIRLNLSWIRLNDGGMFYLKPLTKLEQLRIPLDEVSADGLISLRGMIHLKEFGGKINDEGVRHLSGLKALEYLRISEDSELTDAGLEQIGQLIDLKDLRLLSPHVNGTGLHHLAALSQLERIELGSGVRDISHLPQIRSLHNLTLHGAGIDDDAISPLVECGGLESLGLSKTSVGDAGVAHLKGLVRLRGLSLSETQVGDAGLATLQELPELRSLDLSRTRVSSAGLAVLQRFPRLEQLILYDMPLDEEGIRNLKALKRLKSLSASYPEKPFPDAGSRNAANRELKERLRIALPNCTVY